MINLSQNIVTIISAMSGLATIVASIIAVIMLLIWRKQQRYSPMFQAVMELEDSYELLICEYCIKYNWFYQRFKLASEANGQPKEDKELVDDKIKIDYAEFISDDKLAQLEINYQLAYAKANRFNISLSSYEKISYEALTDFFNKKIMCLQADDFLNKEKTNNEAKRFACDFCSFKKSGLEHFNVIRASL